MLEVRFTLIPIGMTVVSAYLYQYDLGARQRRATKQEERSQNSTPPTPEPIEPRVKPAKEPTPEVADWYVFRSGPKGPYTKLQLREVQKITARTKVRQGEGEWQRAGEISELAKYLTKK